MRPRTVPIVASVALICSAGLGAAGASVAARLDHPSPCLAGLRAAERVARQAGIDLTDRTMPPFTGGPPAASDPAQWSAELARAGDQRAALAAWLLAVHPSAGTAGRFIAAVESVEGRCVTAAHPF